MKNIIKTGLVVLIVILLSCGSVYAGTTFVYYNEIVGRFNGNGYTFYQTKAETGETGWIKSETVGAEYVVDARMEGQFDAPWARDIDDGDSQSLPGYYKQTAGMSIRCHFSNDWNTPVEVQVIGTWKSN